MINLDSQILFAALVGGILPALLWLWFWLKEDLHPEPRWILLLTFIAGMLSVVLVLPVEKFFNEQLKNGILLLLIWSFCEEIFKYIAAYIVALRTKYLNEPIDYVIYMITAALGFAALENAMFIVGTLQNGNLAEVLATGNLRFVGASILHVISSATIGIALAFTYYRGRFLKTISLFVGIVISVLLHALFNFFIIGGSGENIFKIFALVWITAIIFIFVMEKIKRMKNI